MSADWQSLVSPFLEASPRPLLVILGPTASGKTGLAFDIAGFIGKRAEIINADSRQLYRFLDIGTAKVTEEERRRVPHHLIDVLDPKDEATVGWYQREARVIIDRLHAEEKVPLLVGGSMLYLASIIDDLTLAPSADPELREQLTKEYERDAGATLHRRLTDIDPETAAVTPIQNKPRLIRAVEIYELTHRPKSQAFPKEELRKGGEENRLILGLSRPRQQLHERINERTRQMFAAGWIDEVRSLLDRGYGPEDPGMKSHGYQQIIRYLKENKPESLEELQEQIAAKTRQYARRQESWWRGDERIRWLS